MPVVAKIEPDVGQFLVPSNGGYPFGSVVVEPNHGMIGMALGNGMRPSHVKPACGDSGCLPMYSHQRPPATAATNCLLDFSTASYINPAKNLVSGPRWPVAPTPTLPSK